jgi:hypothetical protein
VYVFLMYAYIYIYIEREREKEREMCVYVLRLHVNTHTHTYIFVQQCGHMCLNDRGGSVDIHIRALYYESTKDHCYCSLLNFNIKVIINIALFIN